LPATLFERRPSSISQTSPEVAERADDLIGRGDWRSARYAGIGIRFIKKWALLSRSREELLRTRAAVNKTVALSRFPSVF
jgi:hypothetical protein